MAMSFMGAGRARAPDLVSAMTRQAQLEGQEKARAANERAMNLGAATQIAEAMPEGFFGSTVGASPNVVTPTMVSPGGAVSSAAPVAPDALLGATEMAGLSTPIGAEAGALAADAALAAETGTALGATGAGAAGAGAGATGAGAAGAGAGGGLSGALASMGPVGWAALAALALSAATQ